jgi:hypothetical protein
MSKKDILKRRLFRQAQLASSLILVNKTLTKDKTVIFRQCGSSNTEGDIKEPSECSEETILI